MKSTTSGLIAPGLTWILTTAAGDHPSTPEQPATEGHPCANTMSTVETSDCVGRLLERTDADLLQAMQLIKTKVDQEPSDTFAESWSDQLTSFFKISTNPDQQFEAFRKARRQACIYMNSMTLQGTGFGIFVANCKIDMSKVLLRRLGN